MLKISIQKFVMSEKLNMYTYKKSIFYSKKGNFFKIDLPPLN